MINSYLNITTIAEWLSFIASIFILDKKTTVWRLFILWLFFVLCTETAGWYMYNVWKLPGNALPYNILMLLSIAYFMWFFNRSPFLQHIKKVLVFFTWFFIVFGFVNLFFFQGFWKYNAFSESLGDIIISIVCCYFLFTLVKNAEHIELLQFDYFWLATGILFSSLGNALLYQFSDLLGNFYRETKINVGNYINYTLNLILYSSLIKAFLCRRKTTR